MSEPLAERMRPRSLNDYVGQKHLVGEGAVLRKMIDSGRISSFILWGPPGVGKTTLAQIIAQKLDTPFYTLSAVSSGVKDVREVIERNFGGGWDSLSQSIQDIIESGFDISTTTLPKDRLKKVGGMYDKKTKDGFEVLEIPKGNWVEAIFAMEKPEFEKPKNKIEPESEFDKNEDEFEIEEDNDNDEEDVVVEDHYNDPDEEEDLFDEDKLTEESYRTTYDTDPEALDPEALEVTDDEDF